MRQRLDHYNFVKGVALACLWALLHWNIALGGQLAIIELRHRPASEVIPILSPMLNAGDTLSGDGYKLFVRATPENMHRLQAIIAELDQAPKQLAVTVVQGEHAIEAMSRLAVSGHVTIGDGVTVKTGAPRRQSSDSIDIHASNRQFAGQEGDIQRVLVQNGATATIYVGLSIPVIQGGSRNKGMTGQPVVAYREMLTGVRITPRLTGDRVLLAIETRREHPVKGQQAAVQTQQIQTQVRGRLNQWIDIGTIVSTTIQKGTDLLKGRSDRRSTQRQVFVRVEMVP